MVAVQSRPAGAPRRRVAAARGRLAWVAAVTATVLTGLGAGLPAAVPSSATAMSGLPAYHPSRLTSLGGARQVVVVTAPGWSARRGTLRAYQQRADGSWQRVLAADRVWLGYNGLVRAAERRQSTLTTPAGTFDLGSSFGTAPDPGTALPYEAVDRRDWWPYDPRDPATYNVWQQRRTPGAGWRTSWAEDLSSYGRQYRHAVVVGFNLPSGVHRAGGERVAARPADTRRGGGIFLHVQARSVADRPTAGCVAMPQQRLVRLLRWLDPASDPVVVIGPRSAISRM